MAARYALSTFAIQNSSTGVQDSLIIGEQRDSTHWTVVQAPSLFSSSPVVTATSDNSPVWLPAFLAANPSGTVS